MLRKHQREALEIANSPHFGVIVRKVLAAVTPGGGKSVLPIIFGKKMIENKLADKILWVVPRDNLRRQSERTFIDPEMRRILDHKLEIRASGNDADPSRGLNGYVTTYQSIGTCRELHASEFNRSRYVLVLDEAQHVAEGGEWHKALQPLVDRAVMIVLLSGTLSRDDGNRIAFVDYKFDGMGAYVPDMDSNDQCRVIRYTRTDALREKAILPLYFERVDGYAKWLDTSGSETAVQSLSGIGKDGSSALHTALHQEEYTSALLMAMVFQWRGYSAVHTRSRFLIVAPNITMAKSYLSQVRSFGILSVDIATSDESESAKINIERLQGRKGAANTLSGLVTVGMAYEGMDCPEITHIACLTKIRSFEWIEQMLARATRVDYKSRTAYIDQGAYVWAPDDDMFSEAIKKIKLEQLEFVNEREKEKGKTESSSSVEKEFITPLHSNATGTRAEDIQNDIVVEHDEAEYLRGIFGRAGAGFLNPTQMKRIKTAFSSQPDDEPSESPTQDDIQHQPTASEQEKKLRTALYQAINRHCDGDGDLIKTINKRLIRRFNRQRSEWTIPMLIEAMKVVNALGRSSHAVP